MENRKKEENRMAEFRLMDATKLNRLIEAAELERVEEEVKFLWTKKLKVSYKDNYFTFLEDETKLITFFDYSGFLLFHDLINFLKDAHKIEIEQPEYEKYRDELIELRDEGAVIIDYYTAQKIIPAIENLNISKEEIFAHVPDAKATNDIQQNTVQNQIKQIKTFANLLKQIKAGEVLFIREFY